MAMYKVSPAVTPRRQQNSSTCWLACLEMLFIWKNAKGDTSKDHTKICDLIDKADDLFSSIMLEKGLDTSECKSTARALGLKWSGGGDIPGYILLDLLKAHGPIWIGGQWYMNRSHAIVITGVDPDEGKIRYINPYQNLDLSDSPGTLSWLNDNRGSAWKPCEAGLMYW